MAGRGHRRRWLRACDRLLREIEEGNVADGAGEPMPPALFARFCALGGARSDLPHRRPTGGDLHAAVLDLMERWLRTPLE